MIVNYNKKYKDNSLSNTKPDGTWNDFNQALGSDVESFIKSKLENSVVDFKYGKKENVNGKEESNVLVGYNTFGEQICYTTIVNADVKYSVDFSFIDITVGNTQYLDDTSKIQINKTDNLNVTTNFKYIVTGNVAGSYYNETSAQTVTFAWYNDPNCTSRDNRLPSLQKTFNPGESIKENLNKLFTEAFSNKYLGIEYTPMGSTETIKVAFKSPITLKALVLNYAGEYLLRSNTITKIKLSGLDLTDNFSDYYYTYYLDTIEARHVPITGTDNENLTLELPENLTEGEVHNLFLRVQNNKSDTAATLISNDIQISFIYQKETESKLEFANGLVTAVPDTINNCDVSQLFNVVTTDKLQGNVQIIVLKSNNIQDIAGIRTIEAAKSSPHIFKDITLNLNNTDKSEKISYKSYVEVNTNSSDYLKIFTNSGSTVNISKFYIRTNQNSVTIVDYKQIKIINPKNGIEHLTSTLGSILNFSQINNGNVFTNLSETLDDSAGLQLETENNIQLSTFKVFPTTGVFKEPKPLLDTANISLHKNAFSIEMLIKTYNCNDLNDELLSIGNIRLCPKHLYVYKSEEDSADTEPTAISNASRADFQKEVRQHIIITFDPNYIPNTYNTVYNQLYSVDNITYDKNAVAYPCLKIYINGVINRTIKLNSEDLAVDGSFKLQIHPTNSNINFYGFRTYDKALNYNEIQKNYISSLLTLQDKEFVHEYNNIIYTEDDFASNDVNSKKSILNTISLGKCINKFNSVGNPNKTFTDRRVLLLALPEGIKPPYYGNRKEEESVATFLVHYPNDLKHSGRLYPQNIEEKEGVVKAQGSSAKKYMIHNTSYSKFNFVSEEEWNKETPTIVDYYKMPDDDVTEIKKLVGKVNYASSMQSHKQGATKLFHNAYMSICASEGIDTSWMNKGRKAVLEDDFLYFYTNVPKEDLSNLTWDYFREIDPITGEKTGPYNFENCYFLGFQTWGSGKGDEATSGYDDTVPYYIMLEGADNANAAANFKVPWAAMQCWEDVTDAESNFKQFSGKDVNGNVDYLTGLLIKDETIVYNPGSEKENTTDKRADAWDVAFGSKKSPEYVKNSNEVYTFKDKAKISLNRFAEFYNLVYKYDFSSLVFIPHNTVIDLSSPLAEGHPLGDSSLIQSYAQNYNKLVFGDGCYVKLTSMSDPISVNAGDIYRWEKEWPIESRYSNAPHTSRWVPAGLYYNNGQWDSLNIYDVCNEYTQSRHTSSFFALEAYDKERSKSGNNFTYYGNEYTHVPYAEEWKQDLIRIMAEAFRIIVFEYTNVDDVAYHQAFIRMITGTDNRAKNTYFQIVGPINTDESYKINAENLRKDFKITLYQDDLDTIFKTDNNGQQIKPYYLLEPAFDRDLEKLWGDLHSGFFYNLDILFTEEIKTKLSKLLEYSVSRNWPDNENTEIYKCFLSIQKGIPAIAYNHQSEIYYESAEMLWQKGATDFYKALSTSSKSASWIDFSNNQVTHPLSLSHGSCYDAEVEYLRDRILLLSSYTNSGKYASDVKITLTGGSQESGEKQYDIKTEYTSFIQHYYPTINGKQIGKDKSHVNFDPIIDLLSNGIKEPLVYNINVPGETTELSTSFSQSTLTNTPYWESTDLYKTVYIKSGTDSFTSFLEFPNANTIICQDVNYNVILGSSEEILANNYITSIEHLILQGAKIQALGFDFTGCNRIKTLVLGKTENDTTDDEEPTLKSEYYAIKINDVLNTNADIKIKAGEACTGFKQIILPNSNTLEQLIIPNCVKTLNMGYYPNLKNLKFNNGTQLTNLVIDGRNNSEFVNEIIYNYMSTGNDTTIYITNIPDSGIWLTEEVCRKLSMVEKVNVSGIINIGSNGVKESINFTTKKMLVEKFGLITSANNNPEFKYNSVDINNISVSQTATIQSSGNAPINLTMNGNNIPIIFNEDKYYLNITYKLLTSAGNVVSNSTNISIDTYTGYLTIADKHTGSYIIQTKIDGIKDPFETNLTVGFYQPEVGDFAYGNGTFNSVLDPNLDLVGVVYYSHYAGNNKYIVRVLSSESIIDYPMGPSKAATYNDDQYQDTDWIQQSNYLGFLTKCNLGNISYYEDVYKRNVKYMNAITYNNPSLANLNNYLSSNDINNINEQNIQMKYLNLVNAYGKVFDPNFELNTTMITEDDIDKYNNMYNRLNSLSEYKFLTETGEVGSTYDKNDVGSFAYGLYPAIIKTLYFKPSATLSNSGSEYYKLGKWYVPNVDELSLLIHYRICSSRKNDINTESLWDSNTYGGIKADDNIFKENHFNKIAFLNTKPESLNAINCSEEGVSYYYTKDSSSSPSIKWRNTFTQYLRKTKLGLRTHNTTIYPCCQITLNANT